MTILQSYPIFIPIHSSSGGGEFTYNDANVFLSIFIAFNILWIISLLITLFRYKVLKKRNYMNNTYKNFFDIRIDSIGSVFDALMCACWVIFIIAIISIFIYKLF